MPLRYLLYTACFTGMLFVSCTEKDISSPVSPLPVPNTGGSGKRYLALGDSYTIGQGVTPSERFPQLTRNWFVSTGIAVSDPEYIATTGWTTLNLRDAITARDPKGPYDLVSLLIGVNDQYQRNDTTGYRENFAVLLNKAIALAGSRPAQVVVVSIPDYSVTPYAMYTDTARIRRQIDWFNAINKEVTLQLQCAYLDITPSTREAKTNRALVASDGLHPSGIEYSKWALRLGPLMKNVLQ